MPLGPASEAGRLPNLARRRSEQGERAAVKFSWKRFIGARCARAEMALNSARVARESRGPSSKEPREPLFYPRDQRDSRATFFRSRAGRGLLRLDAVPSQRKPPRAPRAPFCRFFLISR